MRTLGYVLEMLAVFMFISAVRHAARRDFLDDHGTDKGKKYAGTMRAVSVGSRIVCGLILLFVGLRLIGAFR